MKEEVKCKQSSNCRCACHKESGWICEGCGTTDMKEEKKECDHLINVCEICCSHQSSSCQHQWGRYCPSRMLKKDSIYFICPNCEEVKEIKI